MFTLFHLALLKTYRAYLDKLRPHMARAGLSEGQPKILRYILEHEHCSQRELAEYYHIEPATVSRLLAGMEEQGLAARRVPDGDRRTVQVSATERGRAAYETFEVGREQVEELAFAGVSPEEKERFLRLFQRIHDNLTEKGEDHGTDQ